MTGDPPRNALDHLQTAALELIAAARSVLDAAEEVVHDPDALRQATGMFASIVDGVANVGRAALGVDRPHAGGDDRDADGLIERIDID